MASLLIYIILFQMNLNSKLLQPKVFKSLVTIISMTYYFVLSLLVMCMYKIFF